LLFTLCPIHGIGTQACFIFTMRLSGYTPSHTELYQTFAAPSIAPPKRGPIVRSPAVREDTISFPARAVIIVFVAPETAGPWSERSIRTVSM